MSSSDRADLRSVYLYLVCLITLVLVIFATVSAVRNTVQLLYPGPSPFAFEPAFGPDGKVELSPAEEKRREDAHREAERRSAVLGLVGAGTMLAIAAPAYLYHWRRVQAELGRTVAPPPALTES
jgi:hypothetical protein